MAVQSSPRLEMWDPFYRQVQESLIEPLGLDSVKISVPRHQGTNGEVEVRLLPQKNGKMEPIHHVQDLSKKQLTPAQLRAEIQSILDDLLQDCVVQYGSVKFFVGHGLLTKTVFTFSSRPEESSQPYLTNL